MDSVLKLADYSKKEDPPEPIEKGRKPPDDVYVEMICCVCTISFFVTRVYQQFRLKQHDWFYCPVGHIQHYLAAPEKVAAKDDPPKALVKPKASMFSWGKAKDSE